MEKMVKRGQKIITKKKTNKTLGTMAIIAIVLLLMGFYDGPQELVEDVYTVRSGDTLRDVSEKYLARNTGGRRYILEFESGIRELNPELHHSVDIYPGQKIKINYWIKKEPAAKTTDQGKK